MKSKRHIIPQSRLLVGAYVACLLLWLLAMLPHMPGLIRSDLFQTYIVPNAPPVSTVPDTTTYIEPTPLFVVAGAILSAIVLTVIIVAMIRTPRMIGRAGTQLTHRAAEHIIPVVAIATHHPLPSQKLRQKWLWHTILVLNLLLVAAALSLAFIAPDVAGLPPRQPYILTVICLAAITASLFIVHAVLQRKQAKHT